VAVSETTTGCKRPLSALAFITAQAVLKAAQAVLKAAQAVLKAAQAVLKAAQAVLTRSGCFNSLKLSLKIP
jgi:multidrug efflux pump subunit AcrA (membrane-fusion protein)